MVSRLKTYGFLRLNSFFILSPFSPLAVPLYSYRERRTTLSARNPFAPGLPYFGILFFGKARERSFGFA